MKSKIFTGFIALVILVCFCPLYFAWKADVTVYTNAEQGVPVTLHYTLADKKIIHTQQKKINSQGRKKFIILDKNISSVRIETKAKVKEIVFKGRKRKTLQANENLTFDTTFLSSRPSFNFFKFMMCFAAIAYFMAFFKMKNVASPSNASKMMNIEFLRCFFCCEVVYQHIAEQLHFFYTKLSFC